MVAAAYRFLSSKLLYWGRVVRRPVESPGERVIEHPHATGP
jgi:hypothetical protein